MLIVQDNNDQDIKVPSIKGLVEQLREAIKEQYGVEANIEITIHDIQNNFTFHEARKIAKGLTEELF